jgi:hypothetical protein
VVLEQGNLRANERWKNLASENKYSYTARGKKVLKPKRELTKNGRSITVKLTQSEYDEWVKLGKGKWLRAFIKDSRFERKPNDRGN